MTFKPSYLKANQNAANLSEEESSQFVDTMIKLGETNLLPWVMYHCNLNDTQLKSVAKLCKTVKLQHTLFGNYQITEELFDILTKRKPQSIDLILDYLKMTNIPIEKRKKLMSKKFIKEVMAYSTSYWRPISLKRLEETLEPELIEYIKNAMLCKDIIA